MILSFICLLIGYFGPVGAQSKASYEVRVETTYSQSGLPTNVEVSTFLDLGASSYERIVAANRTLIRHVSVRDGTDKLALESEENIFVSAYKPPKGTSHVAELKFRADMSQAEVFGGVKCIPLRDKTPGLEIVKWVDATDPTDVVAFLTYVSGKLRDSFVRVEKRVGLKSDVEAFSFSKGAREIAKPASFLKSIREQFVLNPDLTPQ